jgi:hypothetical protein
MYSYPLRKLGYLSKYLSNTAVCLILALIGSLASETFFLVKSSTKA